jgi:flavin reductase (DIM6/NTAB) family NADH-FMN oxidoreductase RutF
MTQAVSHGAFRDALARFASGVVVVAATTGERLSGFTASAFSSLSLDPPLILVCIRSGSSACSPVIEAARFGVSVLSDSQEWVARQFAQSRVDRFDGVTLRSEAAVPLVDGALAHLTCRRFAIHEAGDHVILVGEVLGATTTPGRPLIHYARSFGAFASGPSILTRLPAPDPVLSNLFKGGSP